jgi:hypothetical protein
MAGTTLGSLVKRTRRFMGDYRTADTITASTTSVATSLTVLDTTKYAVGQTIEVDYETMLVTALTDATHLAVSRGVYDSTAATHASGAGVLKPNFTFSEYVDALNAALDITFPFFYRPVVDESLTATAGVYEYTIPNLPDADEGVSSPIPYITRVSVRMTGDIPFFQQRVFKIIRGSTPKLVFRTQANDGVIRLEGFGPFPHLAAPTDTLHDLFPKRAERPVLVEYAAQMLLASGEARRVRVAAGVVDTREQANQTGSSMSASTGVYQRALQALQQLAMPPMPKPLVRTF